jgi:beta-phosphoglucomutase-like phosphatase (HAD superfamily)
MLLERFHLHASISTIHDFVCLRAGQARKARKRNPAGYDQTTRRNLPEREKKMPMDAIAPRAALDEVQQRIAALKLRPAQAPTQSHYDPSEPLHLPPKTGSGRAGK